MKKKLLLTASILDLYWYFGFYYRLLGIINQVLICDRYIWDTYVEIKTEFKDINIDRWLIWKFLVLIVPKPDVSFIITIPANESIKRDIDKMDLTVDSLELKKNKIDIYMQLISGKKWTHALNGLKPILEIHSDILGALNFDN